jgi:hypothetical protein
LEKYQEMRVHNAKAVSGTNPGLKPAEISAYRAGSGI